MEKMLFLTPEQQEEAYTLYRHLLNHIEVQTAPVNKGQPMCHICGRTAKEILTLGL